MKIAKINATISVNGYTGSYDGAAHGATGTATGVGGANLNAQLNLGATFTNGPGGTAHWTFTGGTNYNDASGDVAIVINKINATISVSGYTGIYDGAAHGAAGAATGVGGANLNAQLNLGATFTNVPGGTATWTFTGGTNYNDATGTASVTINQAQTTTAVTSTVNPSVFGQMVTFTATVSPVAPGAGTRTGTVQFSIDSVNVGSPVALDSYGKATYQTSSLAVAHHPVDATYGGDSNFVGSTGELYGQQVNQASTSTSVSSSLNPSTYGQSVMFTATVSAVAPGAGTPAGPVTFKDGGTTLATGTLNGSGQATFTTSVLVAGSHPITVVYAGDVSFIGSTSATLNQTVNQATTAVMAIVSASNIRLRTS